MVATRRSEKKHGYVVGSKVEILTSDGILEGRLVKKIALGSILDSGPAATRGKKEGQHIDHWMVKLTGESEAVPFSEHAFGKTLELSEDSSATETTTSESDEATTSTRARATSSAATRKRKKQQQQQPKKQKVVQVEQPMQVEPFSAVTTTKTAKIRARMTLPTSTAKTTKATATTTASNKPVGVLAPMVTEPAASTTQTVTTTTTTKSQMSVSAAADANKKAAATKRVAIKPPRSSKVSKHAVLAASSRHGRRRPPSAKSAKKSLPPPPRVSTRSSGQVLYTATDNVDVLLKQRRPRQKGNGGQEEALVTRVSPQTGEPQSVIKVPMNTGILYLYRGKRRSAKFVPLK